MSRSIEDLTVETQAAYLEFEEGMKEAGIDYIVTCTRRTQEEQNALYEQGRSKPGPVVTWTRKSRHIDGTAFDIVIMENGKPCWNTANKNWKHAGAIGRKCGLVWGGDWVNKDFPHFELHMAERGLITAAGER